MKDLKLIKEALITSVEKLDEERVLQLAEEALAGGLEPVDLLDIINEGMNGVGKLYEIKEYYIADLIMAGLIFKQVLDLDQMSNHFKTNTPCGVGRVLLGTVKGDIHDIGKDIFRGMMQTNGFEVLDLGVDVPKEEFVKKTLEYQPHVVGMSGVLTHTVESMKEVVEALEAAGLRDRVKILAGGDHLTPEACKYIGADDFTTCATKGVMLCKEWLDSIPEQGRND